MVDQPKMQLIQYFCTILFLTLSTYGSFATLKKISDTEYIITGRGCGILNEIKYLDHIPEPITELNQCSFINLEKSEIAKDWKEIEGKYNCS